MKKEYNYPTIIVQEFEIESDIADISMGPNSTLDWEDNIGDGVHWE